MVISTCDISEIEGRKYYAFVAVHHYKKKESCTCSSFVTLSMKENFDCFTVVMTSTDNYFCTTVDKRIEQKLSEDLQLLQIIMPHTCTCFCTIVDKKIILDLKI